MDKTLKTGDVELLFYVCGLVTGAARRQTAQEVMRSNFDTGQKISYAFGRMQNLLEPSVKRLEELRQEKAKAIKALRDEQEDNPEKKLEADKLERDSNAELLELLEETEDVRLHGWKFSKLRPTCRTIPATWLSLLENGRVPEDDLKFLKKARVKASRRDLEAVAMALKEVGKPTQDNSAAAYEVGNEMSLAMALTMVSLHPLLLEITEKVQDARKESNEIRGVDEDAPPPAEDKPTAESEPPAEGEPPAEPESSAENGEAAGSEALAEAEPAPEAAAVEPKEDPKVTEKLEAVQKALDEWRDEEIEAEVYRIDIEKIPDDCATIPSNAFQALELILEDEAA